MYGTPRVGYPLGRGQCSKRKDERRWHAAEDWLCQFLVGELFDDLEVMILDNLRTLLNTLLS